MMHPARFGLAGGLLLAALPAMAQDVGAPPGAAVSSQGGDGLADIVVTARRREEGLQDVPVAITALSGDTLAERGVVSTEALRQTAPALNIYQNNRQDAGFYIRGQGPGIIGGGARNFTSVATYFAEVPTAIAGSGVFYDLANVQVLKGPQGTLFGRNTTGGAVLFEPARPTFEFGGSLKGTYGNYDYHEIEGVLNVPIVDDKVALRVAGSYSRRDGFTRAIYTGQKLDSRNHDAFRVSLLLRPFEGFENVTIVDYNRRKNTGSGLVLRAVNPGAQLGSLTLAPGLSLPLRVATPANSFIGCLSAALPGCAPGGAAGAIGAAFANGGFGLSGLTPAQFNAALALQQQLGVRRNLSGVPLYSRVKAYGITNRTTIDVTDNLVLKNIIALRRKRDAETNNLGPGLDFAFSAYPGTGSNPPYIRGPDQFSEELQLQGNLPDLGISYVVGGYHERASPGIDQSYRSIVFGGITNTLNDYQDKSDALFAHLEWQATEQLQLSGGFRYTWDRRFASSSVTDDAGTCTQTNTATGLIQCPVTGRAKFKAPTYDVTAQYKFSPRMQVYAAYRHGYKSGGFNLPAPTLAASTFDKETVDDYEIGLKADWDIGVPLRTNLSLFYDKYNNIQVTAPAIFNGTVINLVQNAANGKNKGGELEVSIKPAEGLTIGGFASYLKARCNANVGNGCRIGRQISYQPYWKAGANLDWRIIDGPAGTLELTSDFSYTGRVNSPDPNAPRPFTYYPGYKLWNARIEWSDGIAPGVDLSAFVTNITDTKNIVGGYPIYSGLGIDSVLYGDPRMYGASVRVRFGSN